MDRFILFILLVSIYIVGGTGEHVKCGTEEHVIQMIPTMNFTGLQVYQVYFSSHLNIDVTFIKLVFFTVQKIMLNK